MLAGDGLTHLFQQVRGEDEVVEFLVRGSHDFIFGAVPCSRTLINKDDILTNAHHGVHVVGVDDGRCAVFLGDGV